VRRHPVTEEIEVEVEFLRVEALLLRLLDQHVDAVFALGAGRDLHSVQDEVVAVGE
jgi:hypothetical protein